MTQRTARFWRKESIEKMHGRPEGSAGYEEDGRPKNVYYSLGWE